MNETEILSKLNEKIYIENGVKKVQGASESPVAPSYFADLDLEIWAYLNRQKDIEHMDKDDILLILWDMGELIPKQFEKHEPKTFKTEIMKIESWVREIS